MTIPIGPENGIRASSDAMLRRSPSFLVLTCVVAGILAAACDPNAMPGTMLGTYDVKGTLGTNTCGAGLAATNPWSFTAKLSKDGSTLYWSTDGGSAPIAGAMTSATEGTLTSTTTGNADGSDAGAGPCNMNRSLTINVTLADGNPPPSFTGTLSYAFAVAQGSVDCSDQLSASGGKYDTLPCTVTYALSANKQ
jgi:hypothetical protein